MNAALTTADIGLPAHKVRVDESGCWLWTAGHHELGYGMLSVRVVRDGRAVRTTRMAHRISYTTAKGPIPEGLQIDHLCRVPACVNPAHLEAVTIRENLMRGVGVAAKNAAKTHCHRGHEFTPENTRTTFQGGAPKRVCRECGNARDRAFRAQKRADAPVREKVAQTHCHKGHEFSEENTYISVQSGSRRRHCRACRSDADRRRRAEKVRAQA